MNLQTIKSMDDNDDYEVFDPADYIGNPDYLHFFDKDFIDGQKVVDILKYEKFDVAVAASVPLTSISYEP